MAELRSYRVVSKDGRTTDTVRGNKWEVLQNKTLIIYQNTQDITRSKYDRMVKMYHPDCWSTIEMIDA